MSIDQTIEEYIYELTKAIGDAYIAIKKGIGFGTKPGSAIYELSQLQSLASRNIPQFGILETIPQGFQIQPFSPVSSYVRVTGGEVGFNGNRIIFNDQLVPIARSFTSTYGNDYVYGAYIGIPFDELQKTTQVYKTTLSNNAFAGDTNIYINDINIPKTLGFPLKAYIDTEFVTINKINDTNNGIILSSSLSTYKTSGSVITFIYEPKIRSICGLPVAPAYQSNGNPSTFSYYPIFPNDWLLIAQLLIKNPNNPSLLHNKPTLSPVRVATNTGELSFSSYNNGTKTLTLGAGGTNIIDGITVFNGDRVLIKSFTSPQDLYNGIYTFQNSTTLVRSTDLNTSSQFIYGLGIGVTDGIKNKNLEFSYQGHDNPIISPPTDILPFTNILVDSFSVEQNMIEWPNTTSTPLFNTAESQIISTASNSAISNLKQIRQTINVTDLILSFIRYTNAISDNPQQSFNDFWSTAPFKTRDNFSPGVSFGNLTRFDFPTSFAEAFFDSTGQDIQHTFGIFRGDLINSSVFFNTGLNPPSYTIESTQVSSLLSTLNQGTYIYGISAVNNSGEGVVSYSSVNINSNNYCINSLHGTNVSGATQYNIYRRSNLLGEQNDYWLNQNNPITSLGICSNTTGLSFGSTGLGLTSGKYYGVRLNAQTDTLLGGVGLKFKFHFNGTDTIINPSDYIDINLYNASGNNLGTLVSIGSTIYYKDITSDWGEIITKFNPTNLTLGNDYFITLKPNRNPIASTGIGVTLELIKSTNTSLVNTETRSGTASTTFPTQETNFGTYIKTYGFIDNGLSGASVSTKGIKLTGNISLKPRELSVLIPALNLPQYFINPNYSLNSGDGGYVATPESAVTKNSFNITVNARNGNNGDVVTLTATVPQNTPSNTRIYFNPSGILVDRVDSIYVSPNSDITKLKIGNNGQIQWSIYDIAVIETKP